MTLEQALARARTLRPKVAAAAGAAQRGRAAGRVASLIPNPQAQFETDHSSPTRKLTFVQPLGWIARRPWDLAVERALRDRGVADSIIILAELGRDVRSAFFTSLASEQQYQLLREQSSLADSLLAIANRRVTAGDISELERDQFAQVASRALLESWEAREQATTGRLNLARAIASRAAPPPRPVGPLDEGLDSVPIDSNDAGGMALPAIRAAVADSIAARNRFRSLQWAMLPIPSLLAGREWGGDQAPRRGAIIGISMPIPIWSQGREAVAESRALAAEQAARTAEARLTLGMELQAARARLSETALRARFARDSLMVEARRVRAGAVRLYEAGRTGVLPVFEALRTERDIARAMVRELLAFQEARADLALLLGRHQ